MKTIYVDADTLLETIKRSSRSLIKEWEPMYVSFKEFAKNSNIEIKCSEDEVKWSLYVGWISFNYELFNLAYKDNDVCDYIDYSIQAELAVFDKYLWEKYCLFKLAFRDGWYNKSESYSMLSSQAALLADLLTSNDIFNRLALEKPQSLFNNKTVDGILLAQYFTGFALPWAKIAEKIHVVVRSDELTKVTDDQLMKFMKLIISFDK